MVPLADLVFPRLRPETCNSDYVLSQIVYVVLLDQEFVGSISLYGGIDQQVLLANGTTKPLSEFSSGSVDDSNYVKKTGQELQIIHVILRRDDEELSMSEYSEDYLTRGEIYNAFISRYDNQTIYGTKTFNSNVNAAGFAKTGKDDTSVLLAGGGDRLLSSFGGIEDLTSSAFSVQDDVAVITYIPFPNYTVDKGGYVSITRSTGLITCSIHLFLDYKMSNVQIDEALLDAAGLSEFPELYAYIHEREPKPIVDGIANQIIVGPQYLQDQVKDNDDKLNVQPIPQPIVPIEIPQVQIFKIPKSQLAANVQMYNPADEYFYFYKLRNKVVYNIGLYLSNDFMGFVFTNFLEELWPFSKHALVLGDDVGHKQNVMGYISEEGFYLGVSIGSIDQVTSIKGNTHIAIADVYYTDYEPLKRAVNDVNGDGKINIGDDWHVNSIIDGMKSMSWVYDVVQKQTEAIDDGVQPYDPSQPVSLSNYFKNNTKLVNNNTFGPLKPAYFAKEVQIYTFNFQAELTSQHVNNVFKVFKSIDSDLQSRLSKFFPIKTSFASFTGMIYINGNDTPDVVVNQGFGYYPMDLSDFSESYLIDPQKQEQNQNNIISNGQPILHIDSAIMQHDTIPSVPTPPSVFPQYTIIEMSREQLLALAYTQYDLNTIKIYIIDDTVNKLVMFNMHLRQKGHYFRLPNGW
ncbi:MAG: hypothetical protein EZS28_021412 [Streblomastix strix]|uniref:Uncharacterized protein n=1 Tax=Streblomastix strix TaxID=222440 RepID=A0A5J4VKF7_9EUKA|nr:MAG: hypothetical protein EZS28_021412 [Streblomastix strix]